MVVRSNCLLLVSVLFTTAALALLAVSFATENWLITTVNRPNVRRDAIGDPVVLAEMSSRAIYFTRNRGLFRTCFPGTEPALVTFLAGADNVVDGWCISEQGYELDRRIETLNWNNYEPHIHLMRAHFGMFVTAIIFLVISFVVTGIGCWKTSAGTIRGAAVINAIAALLIGLGLAFFHGVKYLEDVQITAPGSDFYASYKNNLPLVDNSNTDYGYSYILAWLAVAAALMAAVMNMCTASSIFRDNYYDSDKYPLANPYVTYGSRPPSTVVPPSYAPPATYAPPAGPPQLCPYPMAVIDYVPTTGGYY